MTARSKETNPADVCLLLRAHAEERWLRTQLLALVRELEDPAQVPEGQLGAALAYLEVMWLDATTRAAATDAAHAAMLAAQPGAWLLYPQAQLLYAAVRALRESAHARVRRLTGPAAAPSPFRARGEHAVT